jgi:GntR family transcriptional regulator, transcriptional repressor for pyruvate dehydrogenase complex
MNILSLERPTSLVETVCQQLAKLIRGKHTDDVNDRWLPGERSLAEKLGVSRSVVREATKRLQQLNETRLSIEPDAAAYAAERATKTQLHELRRIHAELEQALDDEAAIQCDLAFHHAIADASGNLIYRLILDSLGEIGVTSRLRTIGRIGKQTAIAHHKAILVAIENRDADAARAAMRTHILAAGQDMDLPALKTRKAK